MRKLLLSAIMLVLITGSGFAQGIQFKSITPHVGLIFPDSPWDTGFLVGAEADLGIKVNEIAIVPVVNYWHSSYSYNTSGTFDLTLSNLQIGADAHFNLPNVVKGLYAGGGLSFNFITSEFPTYNYTTFTTTTGSNTDTNIGFDIMAGYNLALGSMAGVVQARYNIISNLNTFEITLGVTFDMAK